LSSLSSPVPTTSALPSLSLHDALPISLANKSVSLLAADEALIGQYMICFANRMETGLQLTSQLASRWQRLPHLELLSDNHQPNAVRNMFSGVLNIKL